jgi:hypothetical protein
MKDETIEIGTVLSLSQSTAEVVRCVLMLYEWETIVTAGDRLAGVNREYGRKELEAVGEIHLGQHQLKLSICIA